eukprot:1152475-Pelagomonas_calceolata.AAC.3
MYDWECEEKVAEALGVSFAQLFQAPSRISSSISTRMYLLLLWWKCTVVHGRENERFGKTFGRSVVGKSASCRPHPAFPSAAALPLQQPLCSTPLNSSKNRGKHMQGQQGYQRGKIVPACCTMGRGAQGPQHNN